MALVDPLRATAGTRPGRELLPGHLARRPRNGVSPLYFPPRFGRALYPAQDPMALQSRPEDAPVPPRREAEGCGRAGRASGPEGRAARGPSRRGQAGGRAPGKATPERPRWPHRCAAGPAGAADSGGQRQPSAHGSCRPHSEFPRRRGGSAPPSPQLRPDGDPVPASPGVAAAPAAPPCRLGLRAALSAWKLSSSGTSIPQPAQPGPRTTPALTLTLGRRCGARRDSVGSRSAGGRGRWRSWGRSGGTEARGRRVPRPRR